MVLGRAEEEKDLVDRIRQGVERFGEHRGGASDRRGTEFGDRDRHIGCEGGDDGGALIRGRNGHRQSPLLRWARRGKFRW